MSALCPYTIAVPPDILVGTGSSGFFEIGIIHDVSMKMSGLCL
jgi:hypothetical protein